MPDYNDSVFINCPFDIEYNPVFQAIVFTIYRCGFFPITALLEDDGCDNRLGKIERLIGSCRYGVHDLSRIELNKNGLPRFNMPFELGIFMGAKKFGETQKTKIAIIFDIHEHRYEEFISDLKGLDIRAHDNNPEIAIRKIRDWLKTASKRATIPGHLIITREYKNFQKKLPKIVKAAGLDIDNLHFNDFCYIVEEDIKTIL